MAAGDTLLIFEPLGNRPPASGFATLDLRGEFVILDFDDATNEQARFHAKVPSHFKGGNLKVLVAWTSTTAITGNIKLRLELTRIPLGANLDALPAAGVSFEIVATCPATSGVLVALESTPLTLTGLAPADLVRLAVTRLATDGADTMAGDWELVAVEIKEA